MNEKKDDPELPSIKPSQDEVFSYRRSSRSEAPKQSNFNGILVFVIVLMAIMMGVGGFALYEVQKRLEQSNVLLSKGQENIQELENRLSATGTDVSKTLQTMQGQIQTNFEEIDKLWAVSYRQNRPNIQKLQQSQQDMDKRLASVSKQVAETANGFSGLKTEIEATREQLMLDNEDMTTQVSLVRGQIQDQSVKVEGNRRNISILSNQMEETQEAIESNDRFRIQVNQRLLDLQGQIQSSNAAESP